VGAYTMALLVKYAGFSFWTATPVAMLAAGLAGTTPCVIVSQASTPQQLILRLDLASLADAPQPPAPALLLVGEVTRAEAVEVAAAWGAGGQALANQVLG